MKNSFLIFALLFNTLAATFQVALATETKERKAGEADLDLKFTIVCSGIHQIFETIRKSPAKYGVVSTDLLDGLEKKTARIYDATKVHASKFEFPEDAVARNAEREALQNELSTYADFDDIPARFHGATATKIYWLAQQVKTRVKDKPSLATLEIAMFYILVTMEKDEQMRFTNLTAHDFQELYHPVVPALITYHFLDMDLLERMSRVRKAFFDALVLNFTQYIYPDCFLGAQGEVLKAVIPHLYGEKVVESDTWAKIRIQRAMIDFKTGRACMLRKDPGTFELKAEIYPQDIADEAWKPGMKAAAGRLKLQFKPHSSDESLLRAQALVKVMLDDKARKDFLRMSEETELMGENALGFDWYLSAILEKDLLALSSEERKELAPEYEKFLENERKARDQANAKFVAELGESKEKEKSKSRRKREKARAKAEAKADAVAAEISARKESEREKKPARIVVAEMKSQLPPKSHTWIELLNTSDLTKGKYTRHPRVYRWDKPAKMETFEDFDLEGKVIYKYKGLSKQEKAYWAAAHLPADLIRLTVLPANAGKTYFLKTRYHNKKYQRVDHSFSFNVDMHIGGEVKQGVVVITYRNLPAGRREIYHAMFEEKTNNDLLDQVRIATTAEGNAYRAAEGSTDEAGWQTVGRVNFKAIEDERIKVTYGDVWFVVHPWFQIK